MTNSNQIVYADQPTRYQKPQTGELETRNNFRIPEIHIFVEFSYKIIVYSEEKPAFGA